MKIKSALVLAIAIAISQNSFSSSKIFLGSDEDADIYLLKNTIKKISPEIRRYWEEEKFKRNIEFNGKFIYLKGEEVRTLSEINCLEDTVESKQIVIYREDGTIRGNSGIFQERKVRGIIPGSKAERVRNIVCKEEKS